MVHADLKLFLETNLPIGGKKKAMLGVGDAKIGGALQEELGLAIQTGGVVAEILRGEDSNMLWYKLLCGGRGSSFRLTSRPCAAGDAWPVVMSR